jgi:hypothetical protein
VIKKETRKVPLRPAPLPPAKIKILPIVQKTLDEIPMSEIIYIPLPPPLPADNISLASSRLSTEISEIDLRKNKNEVDSRADLLQSIRNGKVLSKYSERVENENAPNKSKNEEQTQSDTDVLGGLLREILKREKAFRGSESENENCENLTTESTWSTSDDE